MSQKSQNILHQECPCHHFQTIQDVAKAVTVDDINMQPYSASILVQWILQQKPQAGGDYIYCGHPCPNRGKISLSLLNAIRDACRIFLKDQNEEKSDNDKNELAHQTKNPPQAAKKYQESCASLSGRNLTDPKKTKNQPNQQSPINTVRPANKQQSKRAKQSANRFQQQMTGGRGGAPGGRGKPKRLIPPDTLQTVPSKRSSDTHARGHPPQPFSPVLSYPVSRAFPPQTHCSAVAQAEHATETGSSFNLDHETADPELYIHPIISVGIDSLPSLSNLVQVYDALIRAHLVPSTAMELHLMMRLLAVTHKKTRPTATDKESNIVFARVFENSDRCVLFAREVLVRQAQILFALGLQASLVYCPPVQRHCPDLIQKLAALEEQYSKVSGRFSLTATNTLSPSSPKHQTALFSLPFDPARDSRHNFRTVEEQAVYKNRESTRDAFLHQLRDYYNKNNNPLFMGRRPFQKSTSPSMQQQVRLVMNGIRGDNFPWFARVFRDLLLQLGPVPLVHETDREVLQMVSDSDVLPGQDPRGFGASHPSKSISTSSNSLLTSSTPNTNSRGGGGFDGETVFTAGSCDQQLQHFPGYQEFFFKFLVTADSFQFGRHLLSALTEKLKVFLQEKTQSTSMEGIDQLLHSLCLLAKFIGVLLFSPYWSSTNASSTESLTEQYKNELDWLTITGISLTNWIQKAVSDHTLVIVMPWIVELLSMTQWAPITAKEGALQDVFTKLRSIQIELLSSSKDTTPRNNSPLSIVNEVFLLAKLETLFSQIAGPIQTGSLSYDSIVASRFHENSAPGSSKGPDQWNWNIPRSILFSADGHIEELVDIIDVLSRPFQRRFAGASRKLRPIRLVGHPTTEQRPPADKNITEVETGTGSVKTDSSLLQAKLVDTFFHQHRDIKEICDTSLSMLSQQLDESLAKSCIGPLIDRETANENQTELSTLERELFAACRDFTKGLFHDKVERSLDLLAPTSCQQSVKEIACTLSVEKGCENAESTIAAAVSSALTALPCERAKREPADSKLERKSVEDDDSTRFEVLGELCRQLESLVSCLSRNESHDVILEVLSKVQRTLGVWETGEDSKIPPHPLLRKIYFHIFNIDSQLYQKLDHWLEGSTEKSWEHVSGFFSIATQLCHLSRYGLPSLVQCVIEYEKTCCLLRLAEAADDLQGFAALLMRLVRSRLVTLSTIKGNLPDFITDRVVQLGLSQAPEVGWQALREASGG